MNLDDPYGRRLTQNRQIPITTYSATGDDTADWRAVAVKLGPSGSTFTVQGPQGAELPWGLRTSTVSGLGAVAVVTC